MKDTYWFKHDSNARMDERTLELRSMYGWEGYGIFWAIVETLREQEAYEYSLCKIGGLAVALGKDRDWTEKFVRDCIDLGLFIEDGQVFYSRSLKERMTAWDAMRESNRKAAEVRWQNERDADAMHMHSTSSADAMPIREEKIREDKSIYTPEFESFWSEYPKKRSKGDAFKAWNQMKCAGLNGAIIEAVTYFRETKDWKKDGGQFIPYPGTWLRARGWEDERNKNTDKPQYSRVWK